jgi:hypothetical protein
MSDKPASMAPSTRVLHESLIRCLKTIVAAYEKWLSQQ